MIVTGGLGKRISSGFNPVNDCRNTIFVIELSELGSAMFCSTHTMVAPSPA